VVHSQWLFQGTGLKSMIWFVDDEWMKVFWTEGLPLLNGEMCRSAIVGDGDDDLGGYTGLIVISDNP